MAGYTNLTPAPVTFDDYFRTIARDAFGLFQVALGSKRFRLDEAAGVKGQNGMTALEAVKVSSAAALPADWDADLRKQLPAKMSALAVKISTAVVIGCPADSKTLGSNDSVWITDVSRGVVLQAKHGEPGASGQRTITFQVLVGR